MTPLKNLLLAFLTLLAANAFAQKTNAEKIVGCWVLTKMELNDKSYFPKDQLEETQKATVCFSADGKFVTTKGGKGIEPIEGTYQVSDDGKKLTQRRKASMEGVVDDDAALEFLDDNHLTFTLEFGKMHFERK